MNKTKMSLWAGAATAAGMLTFPIFEGRMLQGGPFTVRSPAPLHPADARRKQKRYAQKKARKVSRANRK